ncbi:MAG: UDP-3-O-(3-hydroxymyristoyl)glucosamine N-acyltransferase [Verrucomicrobiae bacterium]|nr:UDP-3-O-(3-hydroxymyristoyl)glucosamine N-acyltransferase [Verrucomicrobiae bacterium]
MQLTAGEIAQLIGGEITGNPAQLITGVAGIREAQPGDITFIANPRYHAALKTTQAAAVIVARDAKVEFNRTLIRVDNPVAAFTEVVQRFMPPPVKHPPGIHHTAVIAPDVQLGKDVSIQPHVVIEAGTIIGDRTVIGAGTYVGTGCHIGNDCLIHPNVTIREYTRIGHRVILHSGVVLGADGFGYEEVEGKYRKIPQVGIVEIGDDVEIGANTTVDRARFGKTRIGRGTKIDNLVQIAHNCVIGEDCIICGLAGMAGSTIIGNRVTLAGQVGLAGHLTVGDNSTIMAQAGVTKDVPPNSVMLGSPAYPHTETKQIMIALRRLPDLQAKVRELEKLLARLKVQLQSR